MGLQGDAVVILGVPGSGNSVLAACLAKLGVFLSGSESASRFKELEDLNEAIFAHLGISFHQPNLLPDAWREVPGSDRLVADAAKLLGSKFAGQARFALNEPAITGLLPVYKEVLEGSQATPRYAICLRNPLSVAASRIDLDTSAKSTTDVKNMEPPIGEHLVGLWVHYTLSALKETEGQVRQVVSFEQLLSDPKSTFSRLAPHLLPTVPSDPEIGDAAALIDADCCHHRHSVEELDGWPSIVPRTYDLGLRAAQDAQGLNAGKFDVEIDLLWRESCLGERMVQPIQLPAGELLFKWQDGGKQGQFGVKYSPTGSWQTLRAEFSVPGGTTLQIDPYQTPCQIWIRKAVWRSGDEERPAALSPGPNGALEDLGVSRLTVFGPAPLMTKAPNRGGDVEFEIEFLVQSNQIVLNNLVGMLRGTLDRARRGQTQGAGRFGR